MIFDVIGKQTGWKRRALAFGFGVCATLTLAPFHIFPLIIAAYGGLFVLLESAPSRRQAWWDGWWWGWGFYITGLYWFCIALLTDPEKFAWAIPLALFGLTGIIAIYPAVAGLLYKYIAKGGRISRIYFFAVIWLVAEWVRGHILSGFPWNLAGYAFNFSEASLQLASLLGAYGLTFLAALLGASVAGGKRFAIICWAALVIALTWGYARVQNAGEGESSGAVLRLVQANISQPHKWDPKRQRQGLQEYIRLTQSPGLEKITHVIWPETATPYALQSATPLSKHLGAAIPKGVTLMTGALRMEGEDKEFHIFNSLVALDHEGEIVSSYDKNRLVPFGEFLPLRFLIPASLKLPVGDTDFSRGTGYSVLEKGAGLLVAPLICYEAIFPDYVSSTTKRPDLLLNVTNDAWFGISSGPHQHFQMARMRAVEQGVPLVRVANTGITAYVDEYGRIREKIQLGEKGIVDFKLQKTQLRDTTYTRYGFIIILLLIVISGILWVRTLK